MANQIFVINSYNYDFDFIELFASLVFESLAEIAFRLRVSTLYEKLFYAWSKSLKH